MAEKATRTASEQVKFRVTPVEKKKLEKYAGKVGMTVPQMAKYLSVQQAKKGTVLTNFTTEQYQVLRQDIKRIGVNLNQLTKKINAKEREVKINNEKKPKNPFIDIFPNKHNEELFDPHDKELVDSLRKEVETLWAHL